MSSDDRIFADDWRDCLREQYKYVIRQQDERTERTLTQVLHEVGFSDDEMAGLRLEATMRAEDMPDDYVPDEVTSVHAGVDVAADDSPVEAEIEAEEVPVTYDELIEEVVSQPETLDDEAGPEPDEADSEDDEDSPHQMSLF